MVTFWRNSLKIEQREFEEILDRNGIDFEIWDQFELAYISKDGTSDLLMSLPEYEKGFFYIMNLSSMLGVIALEPKSGEKVLDIAAAPGGKTALMAVMMSNAGVIVANDLSKERIYKMKANFKRLGISNVKIQNKPGEMMWRLYPNYFDKVLADVPCSMDERVDSDQKRIKGLAQRQKRLIWSAFTATRVGGRMVYSTCTSSVEENQEIVQGLLESEPILAQRIEDKFIKPDGLMGTFYYALVEKDTVPTV